jgi:hypothetical protein
VNRRQYFFQVSNWYRMPTGPIPLDMLAQCGLIPGVYVKPAWLQGAERQLTDARDGRETQGDARYGGCP